MTAGRFRPASPILATPDQNGWTTLPDENARDVTARTPEGQPVAVKETRGTKVRVDTREPVILNFALLAPDAEEAHFTLRRAALERVAAEVARVVPS